MVVSSAACDPVRQSFREEGRPAPSPRAALICIDAGPRAAGGRRGGGAGGRWHETGGCRGLSGGSPAPPRAPPPPRGVPFAAVLPARAPGCPASTRRWGRGLLTAARPVGGWRRRPGVTPLWPPVPSVVGMPARALSARPGHSWPCGAVESLCCPVLSTQILPSDHGAPVLGTSETHRSSDPAGTEAWWHVVVPFEAFPGQMVLKVGF